MVRRLLLLSTLVAAEGLFVPPAAADAPVGHWPSFRGHRAAGVADGRPLPVEWDGKTGRNVKWQTAIPGLAHSSPVIWGDRLFITTAVSENPDPPLRVGLYGESPANPEDVDHDYKLYCLLRKCGKVVWEKTANRGKPQTQRHLKSSHANPTPATDGTHVVAFFGSEGLYCYDMDGRLVWQKDLGLLDSGAFDAPSIQWGFGSSPVIHDGKVIVQCDVQQNSFLAAFDVRTGDEIWITPRREQPTWGTPTLCDGPSGPQIICNGYKHIGGYDAATGKEIWKMRGGGDVPVPTPVVACGLIFITNAHGPLAPLYAIRPSAKGDISLSTRKSGSEHVAWQLPRRGNYMQTPIVYRDLLYSCRDNGVLSCFDARTGGEKYQQRLGGGKSGFTASAVAGDGKLYYTSEEGEVYVVKAGPKFELLATNPLGEICMASPAIADGMIYFRTRHQVTAISAER